MCRGGVYPPEAKKADRLYCGGVMTRDQLARAIKEKSYLEGDFTLSSGAKSKYYIDKYLFETEPAILHAIAQELKALIPESADRIASPELGAVAIAAALSLRSGKPFIIVRKEEKGYGTGRRIEGSFRMGEKIVLVEDVVTTGNQILKVAKALKSLKLEVVKIISVIDREEGGIQSIKAAGLDYSPLFTKSELGIG